MQERAKCAFWNLLDRHCRSGNRLIASERWAIDSFANPETAPSNAVNARAYPLKQIE
jgi:hypothetical protein